jgi:hypothetical protein
VSDNGHVPGAPLRRRYRSSRNKTTSMIECRRFSMTERLRIRPRHPSRRRHPHLTANHHRGGAPDPRACACVLCRCHTLESGNERLSSTKIRNAEHRAADFCHRTAPALRSRARPSERR